MGSVQGLCGAFLSPRLRRGVLKRTSDPHPRARAAHPRQVAAAEAKFLIGGFSNPQPMQQNGVKINGKKYFPVRYDDRSIYLKQVRGRASAGGWEEGAGGVGGWEEPSVWLLVGIFN